MKFRTSIATLAGLTLGAGVALAETTKVDVWHVFNIETDMIHAGIAAFNAAHADIEVAPRVLPFAQLRAELVKAVATGDVPDVVVMDNPVTASFAHQGALEDITDLVAASQVIDDKAYFAGPWASVTWDGRIYGVPRASNTIALYYNADMFKAKGLDPDRPPRTWSALMDTAAKLTDKANGVYGIAFSAVQSEEATFQWLPWLYQAGGALDRLDGPEAAEALGYWVSLVKQGYASRDVVNMRQYEGTNTMIAGNAAMAISGPWELPRIDKEAKFDWRVATLPLHDDRQTGASALGGFNWAIPKGAQDRDAAFKFIEFMSSQPVLENAWNTGRLPSRDGIAIKDPNWPAALAVFQEQMKSARARGPHPEWPEISKALQVAIQEALVGAKTPEAALSDAAVKVKPILARIPL